MLYRKIMDVLVKAAHRQQRLQHLWTDDGLTQCNAALKNKGSCSCGMVTDQSLGAP